MGAESADAPDRGAAMLERALAEVPFYASWKARDPGPRAALRDRKPELYGEILAS